MERWLKPRLDAVPPSLSRRIEEAVKAHLEVHDAAPPAEVLRTLAEALLAEATRGATGRETALTLLAADALVTFACEATAELAPEKLAELR